MLLKTIELYLKSLNRIAPKMAANQAFDLIQRPINKKIRSKEKAFYAAASTSRMATNYGTIHYHEMGNPNDYPVVLVHGWESNAGSMYGISEELTSAGFRTISIDLPAHGLNRQSKTNIYECKEVIIQLISELQLNNDFHLISHSFGTLAAMFALSDQSIQVNQFIALSSPNRLEYLFEIFKNQLKLPETTYNGIIDKIKPIIGLDLSDIKASNFVQGMDFRSLSIFHDIHDEVLPFSESKEVVEATSHTELIELNRLGHYRMLWNQDLIREVSHRLLDAEKSLSDYPSPSFGIHQELNELQWAY